MRNGALRITTLLNAQSQWSYFNNVLLLQVYDRLVDRHFPQYYLREAEWTYLGELEAVLKPFSSATSTVSEAECQSTGLAYAIYELLMRSLESKSLHNEALCMMHYAEAQCALRKSMMFAQTFCIFEYVKVMHANHPAYRSILHGLHGKN